MRIAAVIAKINAAEGLKAGTKKGYEDKLKTIAKLSSDGDLKALFMDTKKVGDWVESKKTYNTKKSYYTVIKAILKIVPELVDETTIKFYTDLMDKYAKIVSEERDKNIPNPRIVEEADDGSQNIISWDKIAEVEKKLSVSNYASKEHLIAAL